VAILVLEPHRSAVQFSGYRRHLWLPMDFARARALCYGEGCEGKSDTDSTLLQPAVGEEAVVMRKALWVTGALLLRDHRVSCAQP
jgi:hypothetical protein